MKQYTTYFGVCLLWLLCSLGGYAQNRCWNDKKIPKEWFITALGGYTFGYGEPTRMPSYNSTYYFNRDDFSSNKEIRDIKDNYDQNGSNIGLGGGIYLNKSIGVMITAGYFWGKNISGQLTSISNYGNASNSIDIQHYYSTYLTFYKSWSVSPSLLYKFVLNKGFVFSMLGISYGKRTHHDRTDYHTKYFYQGELVQESSSNRNTVYKEESFILGVICGLGYCYPISSRIDIVAQIALTNQRHLEKFRQLIRGNYKTNDGIALCIGIKYNIRPSNIVKQ